MKLQHEYSREFKKKTIFVRLPPLESAALCGPHPLAKPLANFNVCAHGKYEMLGLAAKYGLSDVSRECNPGTRKPG